MVVKAERSNIPNLFQTSATVVNPVCNITTALRSSIFASTSSSGDVASPGTVSSSTIIGAAVGSIGVVIVGAIIALYVVKTSRKKRQAAINNAVGSSVRSGDIKFAVQPNNESQRANLQTQLKSSVYSHQTTTATAAVGDGERVTGRGVMLVDPSQDPKPMRQANMTPLRTSATGSSSRVKRNTSSFHPSSPDAMLPAPPIEEMIIRDASVLMPPPPLRKETSASAWGTTADEVVGTQVSLPPVRPELAAMKGSGSMRRDNSMGGGRLQISTSQIEVFRSESPRDPTAGPRLSKNRISPESSSLDIGGPNRIVPTGWVANEGVARAGPSSRGGSDSSSRPATGGGKEAEGPSHSLADAIGALLGAPVKK